MRSAIASGSRAGRPRWPIDKRYAPSCGKPRESLGWSVPCSSSSSGASGCIGCLIPLLLLLPRRRLRSTRSPQRLVLALGTPGANPFCDVLLPPLLLPQSLVQKNEPHPFFIEHLQIASADTILF